MSIQVVSAGNNRFVAMVYNERGYLIGQTKKCRDRSRAYAEGERILSERNGEPRNEH